jgi:hypothetical protein
MPKTTRRHTLPVALSLPLAALVFAVAPPPAIAGPSSDVAGKVYEDVSEIFEQLAQQELGNAIATFVESQKDIGPGLRIYLRRSLERLRSSNWGSLPSSLRRDLVDLAADAVFDGMDDPAGNGDFDLRRTLIKVAASPAPAKNGAVLSLIDRSCSQVQRTGDADALRCATALGIRATLTGSAADAKLFFEDAITVLASRGDGGQSIPLGVVRTWISRPEAIEKANDALRGETWVRNVVGMLPPSGNTADICDGNSPVVAQLALPNPGSTSPPAWACLVTTAATVAKEPHLTLSFSGDGKDLSVLLSTLAPTDVPTSAEIKSKLEAALSERLCSVAAGGAWTCAPGKVITLVALTGTLTTNEREVLSGAGGNVTCEVVGGRPKCEVPVALLSNAQIPVRNWAAARAAVSRYRHIVSEHGALQDALGAGGGRPLQVVATADRAVRVLSLMRRARELSEAGGAEGGRGLLSLVQASMAAACGTPGGPATDPCSAMRRMDSVLAGAAFVDVIRSASRDDYRSLATAVLSELIEREQAVVSDDHFCLRDAENYAACRSFVIDFASYALDVSADKSSSASRASFKAAAVRVLSRFTTSGFPRGGRLNTSDGHPGRLLVPQPSLRFSWSSSYAGVDSDLGNRYTPVISFITLRYAVNNYLGVQFSAVDLFAPVSEMALRPSGTYSDHSPGLVLLDAVRPRIDLLGAIPEFSRTLALVAGASLRTIEPRKDDAGHPIGYRVTFGAELNLGVALLF